MNMGSVQPQQQQQPAGNMFEGLNQGGMQQQPQITPIITQAPIDNSASKKSTLWDTSNSKLFDISASTLKDTQQKTAVQQVQPNLLSTDPNSPGIFGGNNADPFGSAL